MKNTKNQIDSLYISCMNCSNTEKTCKGILKNLSKGIPPRGFLFMSYPVKILIVSKNPGHPLQGEKQKYIGKKGIELYHAYRNHQRDVYYNLNNTKDRSLIFHKNLFNYVSFFLDLPNDIDVIYQHVAHTNLVKCSTKGERDKLNKNTMEECYNKYFKEELDLLKPKVLLALGREVEKYLIDKMADHNLPVIYVKHPAYHYRKQDKEKILIEIKKRIGKYIKD
jgi:uracil-DNA glycosylase